MKVVIVGGGPAGLITGLCLLKRGISPLILEKNAEISSTACAEGCDLTSLKQIPFDSSQHISKEVDGAEFIFPGSYSFSSTRKGAVLDRNRWLRGMAAEFAGKGGVIKANARVKSIGSNVIFLENGDNVAYDILIGADGPFSIVRKHMGIPQELLAGVQYKIKCNTSNIDHLQFYFDKRFSSHYSWVFPKKEYLNVGLAGKFSQLDIFVDFLGLKGKILKKEVGAIPVGGIPGKIVKDNIALIGDAASMTNPLSGGGIAPIIYASDILSRNVYNLNIYEVEIKKHPMFHAAILKAKNVLMKATNTEMGKMGKVVDGKVFEETRYSDLLGMTRYPLLVPKILLLSKGVIMTMRWGW